MSFLAAHTVLLRAVTALLVVVLAVSITWIGLRSRPTGYRPLHFSPLEAGTSPYYVERHSPEYHAQRAQRAAEQSHGRHAAADSGPSAYLGRSPDGELALVDDEHTHELIGAAA